MRTIAAATLLVGLTLVGLGQTQVQVTTGTFVFEMGQKLALELAGDDPCPCTCETITVAGFLILDAHGFVIYDETSPYPIPSDQWMGLWNLVAADGMPVAAGEYTALVVTSLGDFRAELQVTDPGQAPRIGKAKAKATVCGIGLTVYRLLDESDADASISLREGEHLLIALEGNPTTGFGWEVKEQPDFLTRIEGPAYRSGSDLPGAGGTFYFRYEITATGVGTLSFAYRRPWEVVPPERSFTLQLIIP